MNSRKLNCSFSISLFLGVLFLSLTSLAWAQVPPPVPPPGGGPPPGPGGGPPPGERPPGVPPIEEGIPEDPNATLQHLMPVQIVGNRLITHCEVSTVHRRIPVNLFVDFENPCGLQLHNNAAGPLKAEDQGGQTIPITIHFPGFDIVVQSREQGPEPEFNEFTRLWSREMGEDALVGTIGAKILRNYRIIFDLKEGHLELLPSKAGTEEPPPEPEGNLPPDQEESDDKSETISISTTDDIVWIPVQIPGEKIAALAITTSFYDSKIDALWADDLGKPAGNVSPVQMGKLDLSKLVAFRPEDIPYVHPDGALGTIGLNLLKNLWIDLDRDAGTAKVRLNGEVKYPEEDFEFFKAWLTEDADELELCLAKYPTARLSQETARTLLDYRMDEGGSKDEFERVLKYLRNTWRKDIVTTRALDLMKELRALGYNQQALFTGDLGIKEGRKDRYPEAIHNVHSLMGEILLEGNEDKRAWRHLLSAAFGMPENGRVNLRLGEFYERQGRYKRAMSRYVQAVIAADSGEQAIGGLERVQKHLGTDERISVDKIEQLIAGKVYNYRAATKHKRADNEANRTVLLEFFTNAHIKHPTRDEGAIGGALGNEGLLSHFPQTALSAVSFHLPHPRLEMDSLTNEVSQYHADFYGAGPAVQIVDGRGSFPGTGKAREAEQIYKRGRQIVRGSLLRPSAYSINLNAALDGDVIKGKITVSGPERDTADLHILLIERGVLYPGKSKVVIHKRVARAALTPTVSGIPFRTKDSDRMEMSFGGSLQDIEKRNIAYLKQLEAEGRGSVRTYAARMDPRQLSIVAFLRDNGTKRVLQSKTFDLGLE